MEMRNEPKTHVYWAKHNSIFESIGAFSSIIYHVPVTLEVVGQPGTIKCRAETYILQVQNHNHLCECFV